MGTQQLLVPAKNLPTDGVCKRFSINDTAERVGRRHKLLILAKLTSTVSILRSQHQKPFPA